MDTFDAALQVRNCWHSDVRHRPAPWSISHSNTKLNAAICVAQIGFFRGQKSGTVVQKNKGGASN